MTAAKAEASDRARAIIDGLVRTGRGTNPQVAGAYVRLRAQDGRVLLGPDRRHSAIARRRRRCCEELQESFAETMARAGETPPKRTR
jgi:hypothetical protein